MSSVDMWVSPQLLGRHQGASHGFDPPSLVAMGCARIADDHGNHRGRKPVQVVGSDTLKPYAGLLHSRKAICMPPRRPDPAGNKSSVFLPGYPARRASAPASVRRGR